MTLREECEVIRGRPIGVFTDDPRTIQCIETSDKERLCRHPIVSVHMICYNQEKFIRRAIEGVMMQETDFQFELVIGEDCSSDRTREICFEYQKCYPEKIRVLWAEVNVNKLGGNYRRVLAHCRGEYIAFCEGDDYWTDPKKLQKQMNVVRQYPTVGLCFTGANIIYEGTGKVINWNAERTLKPGLIPGRQFFVWHLFGQNLKWGTAGDPATFIMTATTLFRRSLLTNCEERYEVMGWKMMLSDTTMWLGLSSLADVFYLEDETAVYFKNAHNIMANNGMNVAIDGNLIRTYFAMTVCRRSYPELPYSFRQGAISLLVGWQLNKISRLERVKYFSRVARLPRLSSFFWPSPHLFFTAVYACLFSMSYKSWVWMRRFVNHLPFQPKPPDWLQKWVENTNA